MIEERQQKQRYLENLEQFLTSPTHAGWVAGKKEEQRVLVEQIKTNPCRTVEDILTLVRTKIMLEAAAEHETTFEVARDTLKNRIKVMLNEETESRQQNT